MLKTFLAIPLAISLSAQASGQPRKSKFLLVSDLHFNPMADPVLVKGLEAAEPAQWEAILDRALPNTLSQIYELVATEVGDGVISEDVAPSGVGDADGRSAGTPISLWERRCSFSHCNCNTSFPARRSSPLAGNNDDDCGDYTIEANGTFLRDTSRRWRANWHAATISL